MPANILNLTAYHVTHIEENEHDYHIDADVKIPPSSCPHCHSTNLVGFGRREQMIKDLPMHGRRVGIYVNTRRIQCRSCSKTFSETLPDVDERRAMTRRLVDWIGKQAVKRTFAGIAEEVGVTEGTIRLIFKDCVAELEKTIRFETPKWMGIDEIHLIRPRGVIANIQNNTIVELLPNRNKETVVRYLHHLEGKDRVQYVAMDMWQPYRDACLVVIPQAQIIIDKFHVLRMANDAMERVRKRLREQLTPKQRRGLMHDRFVLLKRERDLNDRERLLLSGWTKNYPEIGEAYRLKEDFFTIYEAKSPDEAQGLYLRWKTGISPGIADAYADLSRAWENWHPYILGYFDHPVTNAYTESLNNLIRVMNRLGRGYSFEALRAKILFTEGIHKHKLSRPKFERRREPEPVARDMMMGGNVFEWAVADFTKQLPVSTRTEKPEKNYGADINTLIELLEAGKL
jgi:transposase